MGFTFSYTSNVYLQREVVYLPTLYQIDKWFKDDSLSSELEENTMSRMNNLLLSGLANFDNANDGIPLNVLIEKIQNRSETIISWCLTILQQIIAILAAIYFGYKIWIQVKLKLLPQLRK